MGPRRGSFQAVMDILQGKSKLHQAKDRFLGKILKSSPEDKERASLSYG